MLKPNPYHNKGTIEFAIIGLNTYVATCHVTATNENENAIAAEVTVKVS